jgi:ketosteroid isomerase-like protein
VASDQLTVVQEGLAAFNRREYDEALRRFSPELEWDTTRLLPDGRVYSRREAVGAYWTDVVERWDELRIVADRWLEGDDYVLMLGRLVGRGAEGGVPVEGPWHQLWWFRGGVPVRCDNYGDAAAALRDAGLAG